MNGQLTIKKKSTSRYYCSDAKRGCFTCQQRFLHRLRRSIDCRTKHIRYNYIKQTITSRPGAIFDLWRWKFNPQTSVHCHCVRLCVYIFSRLIRRANERNEERNEIERRNFTLLICRWLWTISLLLLLFRIRNPNRIIFWLHYRHIIKFPVWTRDKTHDRNAQQPEHGFIYTK